MKNLTFFYFLRYEDFIRNPSKFVSKIYNFISPNFAENSKQSNITEHITNILAKKLSDSSQLKKIEDVANSFVDPQHDTNPRNSSITAYSWVKDLRSFTVVDQIQRKCSQSLFTKLGYRYFDNEFDYFRERTLKKYLLTNDSWFFVQ